MKCIKCGKEKDENDYPTANYCRECQKEFMKKRYEKKRHYVLSYIKNYYQTYKKELIQLMGNKCAKCGLTLEDVEMVLDVFIIDEIKPLGIGKKKFTNLSKSRFEQAKQLYSEGKLQLLCANCSAIKTNKNNERKNSLAKY